MTSFSDATLETSYTDDNGMRLELHRSGDKGIGGDGMIRLIDVDVHCAGSTEGVVSITRYLGGRYALAKVAYLAAVAKMEG